jgi:hypothetical protein
LYKYAAHSHSYFWKGVHHHALCTEVHAQVVQEMLRFYSEQGDVQTCVAIALVLGDRLHIDRKLLLNWITFYLGT